MFKFRKKPFVLSQTNILPYQTVENVLKAFYEVSPAPVFSDVAKPSIRHVTIAFEPFSLVTDRDGGKVHLCTIEGHYYTGVLSHWGSKPLSANILIRLYENCRAPCIAYEGSHDVTVDGLKLRVEFASDGSFKFAGLHGEEVLGSWYYSTDALPLHALPYCEAHTALYAQRISRLGYLRRWKRSQLLEATKDISVVAAAEKILARFGHTFKPE